MRAKRWAVALAAVATVGSAGPPASGDPADPEKHCVYRLVPIGYDAQTNTIRAALVEEGCYDTAPRAAASATDGRVRLPRSTTPRELTQSLYDASGGREALAAGDVLIGEEWDNTNFDGGSAQYYANVGCGASNYEVDYVGNFWNDRFEAGKGFGNCDKNRKFKHSNFNGDSLLCTPNCSNYGDLRNDVSSLRWRNN